MSATLQPLPPCQPCAGRHPRSRYASPHGSLDCQAALYASHQPCMARPLPSLAMHGSKAAVTGLLEDKRPQPPAGTGHSARRPQPGRSSLQGQGALDAGGRHASAHAHASHTTVAPGSPVAALKVPRAVRTGRVSPEQRSPAAAAVHGGGEPPVNWSAFFHSPQRTPSPNKYVTTSTHHPWGGEKRQACLCCSPPSAACHQM